MQESRTFNRLSSRSPVSVTSSFDGLGQAGPHTVDPRLVAFKAGGRFERNVPFSPNHQVSVSSRKRPLFGCASKAKKSVRFCEDQAGPTTQMIVTTGERTPSDYISSVEPPTPVSETKEDMPQGSLWWSRKEISQRYQAQKLDLAQAKQLSPCSCEGLERLVKACYKDDFSAADYIHSRGNTKEDQLTSLLKNLAPHDFRGLEHCLNRGICASRTFHVRNLIKIQKKLPKGDYGLRDRLLRRISLHTSRPLRNLARVLAHMDSMEVVCMAQEELCFPNRKE